MRRLGWKDRYILASTLLLVTLVFCNIAFIDSGSWARLLWNSLGYLALGGVYLIARLNPGDVGLSLKTIKPGLKYAGTAIAIIFVGFLIVFLVDKTAIKDPRYNHSLATALFAALILLPAKTVLFEEFAFRGLIPALSLKLKFSKQAAMIISSVTFGFWHILSATKIGNYHLGGFIVVQNWLVVISVFTATSAAGYMFCWLRFKSGSLVTPIAVHWFLNGFGIILASIVWSL